jgi:DNA (cytosine-5)-methyltransferase 1
MKHGSLFSGIGGFDLASQWMGWDNVFHCEINPFGQRVLKYHFPNAISYEDITKTDFSIHRGAIDIITGGFPCQPFSNTGKRLGTEDPRHLWPEMLRAIREIKPRFIVGENVSGLVNWNAGMVFDEVQADLEAEGYKITPFLIPASSVGAPHKRERIWFIAYSESVRTGGVRNQSEEEGSCDSNELSGISHRLSGNLGTSPDTKSEGLQGCEINGSIKEIRENGNKQLTGFLPPIWKNFPTQPPICNGDDGLSCRLDGITFPKWRNESIKAGGNAIVPQVALQIFKSIEKFIEK